MINRLLFAALLLFVARADATYESVVAADTPCHWWKMQETSLSAIADTQGAACSNHDMTWTGSPLVNQSATGVVGKVSVALNGSNQYAVAHSETGCGYTPSTSGGSTQLHMSWEYWGRVHGNNSAAHPYGVPFNSYEPGAGGWFGYLVAQAANNVASWGIVNAASSGDYRDVLTATVSGSLDVFHHVVATWDGSVSSGTLKIYLDGAVDGTTTTGSGTCCACAEYISFGSFNNHSGDLLNGNLQYVAMYGGPGSNTGTSSAATLTPTQVAAHYNAGIAVPHGAFPWIVRKPELPQFRNPDYFARVSQHGYHTGIFDLTVLSPQFFYVGYLPFTELPDGIEKKRTVAFK